MIGLKILAAWFLADFISGVAHWAEDILLMRETRGILERVRLDNVKHHKRPGYVTLESFWGNINTTAPFSLPLALIAWLIGAPLIVWLALIFVTFGNYVHRLAHEIKVGKLVGFLHWTELFIPWEQHDLHHFNHLSGRVITKEESKDNYCVMTGWLNPILDSVGFWRKLEWILRVER